MRPQLVLSALLASAAFGDAAAQCSPAIRKLETDQRFDEARAEVQAQLKKNDRDDAAVHCMGRLFADQGNSKDAVEWFERAIRINEKSSAHHLWLANSLGDQASHASKIKLPFLARRIKSEFDRAAQLDPASIDARHGLIEFYSKAPGVMGGSMEKAKEQATEIGKLSAWRGAYEMARLLEQDKDLAGAEKNYLAGVAAAPDSTQAANFLAGFYRRQKRWNDAVVVYENLLKRRPDALGTKLNIAFTLNASGQNLDRAERETRAWLAAPPADSPKMNFAIAHFILGQVAEKQGKKESAKAEYQQAIALNPGYGDAKKALDALK